MKTVKVRFIFLGLSTMILASMMLTSCEQNTLEDLNPIAEEQLILIENRVPLVIGTWWNSYEEENNPTVEKIYRRDNYNFPTQQIRTGFTFDANGDFVYYYTNAAGQPIENHGTWRFLNSQLIMITFDFSLISPIGTRFPKIDVISMVNNKLVIEPLSW